MTIQPISAGMTLTQVQRVTPNNGDTITINNVDGELYLIIAPSGALTSLNLVWPSSPYAASNINIVSTQTISGITHSGNTLNVAFSSIKACGSAAFRWDSSGATYMCTGVNAVSPTYSITYTATVSGGNAVFYITNDGTATGTALFSGAPYIQANFYLGDPNYAVGVPVISNSNRTVTVPCFKQTFTGVVVLTLTVLGTATIAAAPNGSSLSCLVTGVLA